jgi:hypothetical protein
MSATHHVHERRIVTAIVRVLPHRLWSPFDSCRSSLLLIFSDRTLCDAGLMGQGSPIPDRRWHDGRQRRLFLFSPNP